MAFTCAPKEDHMELHGPHFGHPRIIRICFFHLIPLYQLCRGLGNRKQFCSFRIAQGFKTKAISIVREWLFWIWKENWFGRTQAKIEPTRRLNPCSHWRVRLRHTWPICNLSAPRLRYGEPKINTMSAEQLLRAMLPLLLPFRPCHC